MQVVGAFVIIVANIHFMIILADRSFQITAPTAELRWNKLFRFRRRIVMLNILFVVLWLCLAYWAAIFAVGAMLWIAAWIAGIVNDFFGGGK